LLFHPLIDHRFLGSRPAPLADTAPWRALPCPRRELRLDLVLRCGQSFRWQESRPGYWSGVLAGRVWTLTQREEQLWFTLAPGPAEPWPGWEQAAGADTPQQILQDYFQLHVGLAELYQGWGDADPHFRHVGRCLWTPTCGRSPGGTMGRRWARAPGV
uniref:8-oxoguanine DNA glycosylase N-terminal domain-containing protein n=1 Tax=Sphenodon punctatus TaxID=8508 RepID=A0A8D0GVN9_SPHPU